MNRISADNPVRRRLFDVGDTKETDLDNFTNVLQEEALRVQREKMRKWNFDFENDTPLDGHYEWTRCNDDGATDYVGRPRCNDPLDAEIEEGNTAHEAVLTDEEDCEEKANLIQKKNETTPDKKTEDVNAPLMKNDRRPTDSKTGYFNTDKSVRRNIFE